METHETSNRYRSSNLWDYYVPIFIAAFPPLMFLLLRLVTTGLNRPNAEIPAWQNYTMAALQITGMISMAILILVRYEFGKRQLLSRAQGQPSIWRHLLLKFSMACLLLFDILANVGVFARAEFLFVAAIPVFVVYIISMRLTFSGL